MTDPIEQAIDAALAADAEWMRKARRAVFVSPSRDQVRVMLEAGAPLIAAAAEARLAEVRQVAVDFRAHYAGILSPDAEALYHAVLQVADRDKASSEEDDGDAG